MKAMGTEIRKYIEFGDKTIEALICGFEKPIILDYSIPSAHNVTCAAVYAVHKLCGGVRKEARLEEDEFGWFYINNKEKIEPKVREGLSSALGASRNEDSFLDVYMISNEKLDYNWFFSYGNLYKFKEGEREDVKKAVREYWKPKEFQNFLIIFALMEDYIKRYFKNKK